MTVKILLAGGDEQLEKRLSSALPEPFGAVIERWDQPPPLPENAHHPEEAGASIVVIGPHLESDPWQLAAALDTRLPWIPVLVVAKQTADSWRQAVGAGVRGVIALSASDSEVAEELDRALKAARARATGGAPQHRVITVASPKGGVGKTVVSSNLAVVLAAHAPRDTVLLDLDLQFGDAAHALTLNPQHTIEDAVGALSDDESPTFKVFLTPHDSGLLTLCAPADPAAADFISPSDTGKVIDLVASEFSNVVVDTGAGIGPHTLEALERSTDVVLISDMDVPSVRNVRKVLDALDQMGMTSHERHVVLNRANTRVGLTRADLVTAVGMPFDLELPSSRRVPLAVNEGRPIVLTNPRTAFSRRIVQLAERFAADDGGRRRRRRRATDAEDEKEST